MDGKTITYLLRLMGDNAVFMHGISVAVQDRCPELAKSIRGHSTELAREAAKYLVLGEEEPKP